MCRNPKLWIAVAAAVVLVAVAGPSLGTVLPILLVAACPLSMLVMAGGMARMARRGGDGSTAPDGDVAEIAELREHADR